MSEKKENGKMSEKDKSGGDPFDELGMGSAEGSGSENSEESPKASEKKEKKPRKLAEKPVLTPKDKFIKKILRKAGVKVAPELSQLVDGKIGDMVEIKDIGIFLGEVEEDEVIEELSKECAVKNRCNPHAEVMSAHVMKLGAQIIRDGRMFQPITCAKITEDGALECTSGRHRLVFFALLYGATSRIPVYVENMTLNMARNAVVRANESRSAKAMERAEHVVLSAVGGNVDVEQEEMYAKVAVSKKGCGKYCLVSVLGRKYPCELTFSHSQTAGRHNGGLTTDTILENYWNAAIDWNKDMDRKTFDHDLKASTKFINSLVKAMQLLEGFEAKQHLSNQSLVAIGSYYRQSIKRDETLVVEKIAEKVVALKGIGRLKSGTIYDTLCKGAKK